MVFTPTDLCKLYYMVFVYSIYDRIHVLSNPFFFFKIISSSLTFFSPPVQTAPQLDAYKSDYIILLLYIINENALHLHTLWLY